MTLDCLKPGQGGIIETIGGEGALRRRLLDMGLTPKTKVKVRKVAPMGDPIELHLRGYVLTLRAEDAAKITLVEGSVFTQQCDGEHHHRHRHGQCESCGGCQKSDCDKQEEIG